ncbi:MAG: cyclase family protein [Ktedonobacteraceae bacterium]|nr:cyclase family protein [Ktedonobacteraceae bacterium]
MATYVDLSQFIENGMTYFPGDPEPRILPAEAPPPWRVTQLHIGTHLGTHIDAASHFIPHGKPISEYPLERFLLPGIMVPVTEPNDEEPIDADVFADYLPVLPTGGALLIHTGWDRYWKTERYLHHPFLSHEAAQLLAGRGVSLVGIDALSVDSTIGGTEHAHAALLGNDVLIVENLTRLDQLVPGILYQCSFLPLALRGLDGSPIRAIAWRTC